MNSLDAALAGHRTLHHRDIKRVRDLPAKKTALRDSGRAYAQTYLLRLDCAEQETRTACGFADTKVFSGTEPCHARL